MVNVTLCWFLYSVRSFFQIASSPYHKWLRSNQLRTMNVRNWSKNPLVKLNESDFTKLTNFVHSWYGVGVTVFIHGTELMWPCKVMVRSLCDRVHSWYGVNAIWHAAGVIPQSHCMWFLCTLNSVRGTLHSCNSFGGFLKHNVKKSTKFHT
jgi:hypothetical protein